LNSSKANQLSEGDSLVILGLAYKIDTSSLIESHALKIANAFQKKGISVRAHDFLVDFSSQELDFLDYGSNSLDKKLLENAQGILISHGDPRYREFLSGGIINNTILIDPWGIIDGF
jgi:UDP-N-acetyl-D-mannosaminuronate dehydrogenase